MSWFGERSYYFEQLREFVPRDALSILDQQKEKVRKAIDEQVDEFSKQLSDQVEKDVEQAKADVERLARLAGVNLQKVLSDFAGQELNPAAVKQLKAAIGEYENTWKGLGEQLAKAAKKAVKASTGLG